MPLSLTKIHVLRQNKTEKNTQTITQLTKQRVIWLGNLAEFSRHSMVPMLTGPSYAQ